jgi:hypothetical protein
VSNAEAFRVMVFIRHFSVKTPGMATAIRDHTLIIGHSPKDLVNKESSTSCDFFGIARAEDGDCQRCQSAVR